MTISAIRQALETALDGMNPALATSWENVDYSPVGGTPYQDVYLLPAEPENAAFSGYREMGIFQVTLKYPTGKGTAEPAARAELLQALFARGKTFTKSGVTVQIERTPEILPHYIDNDRYCLPVRVRYFANI